jgi:hypothetical protein
MTRLDVFDDFVGQPFADAFEARKPLGRLGRVVFDQGAHVGRQILDHPRAAGVGVDPEAVLVEQLERCGDLLENLGDLLIGDHDFSTLR